MTAPQGPNEDGTYLEPRINNTLRRVLDNSTTFVEDNNVVRGLLVAIETSANLQAAIDHIGLAYYGYAENDPMRVIVMRCYFLLDSFRKNRKLRDGLVFTPEIINALLNRPEHEIAKHSRGVAVVMQPDSGIDADNTTLPRGEVMQAVETTLSGGKNRETAVPGQEVQNAPLPFTVASEEHPFAGTALDAGVTELAGLVKVGPVLPFSAPASIKIDYTAEAIQGVTVEAPAYGAVGKDGLPFSETPSAIATAFLEGVTLTGNARQQFLVNFFQQYGDSINGLGPEVYRLTAKHPALPKLMTDLLEVARTQKESAEVIKRFDADADATYTALHEYGDSKEQIVAGAIYIGMDLVTRLKTLLAQEGKVLHESPKLVDTLGAIQRQLETLGIITNLGRSLVYAISGPPPEIQRLKNNLEVQAIVKTLKEHGKTLIDRINGGENVMTPDTHEPVTTKYTKACAVLMTSLVEVEKEAERLGSTLPETSRTKKEAVLKERSRIKAVFETGLTAK